MHPIILLLVAMAIVVGCVICFRLHAFLALLLGAIVVAAMSSPTLIRDTELRAMGYVVRSEHTATNLFTLKPPKGKKPFAGDAVLFRQGNQSLERVGDVRVSAPTDDGFQEIVGDAVEVKVGDLIVRSPAAADSLAARSFAERIKDGFGSTCGSIGILIALASIVGACLLQSGAADRIVGAIRQGLGERNTPAAFTLSGFIVGIPVFFDTVFYLLLPLAKAMHRKTGVNYLLYVLSVVIGATMAHSLVPPTPGPLFVANELEVDLGRMMLGGTVIGLFAAACGFAYAVLANKWWTISLPDKTATDDSQNSNKTDRELPPLWLSLLPILLPVVLLGTRTILEAQEIESPLTNILASIDSTMAIGIAAAIGLLMAFRYADPNAPIGQGIQSAIQEAGSIILITCIGGAFGHVLRQSGIAYAVQQQFPITQSGTALLCVAFAITAIVRVAQGSATVAMITSIGIVGPLASSMELPFDPVYLALAIGCGSKPMPWMNDSGFWVVGRMSGMTERETLSTFSVCLTIMGIAGFAAVLLASQIMPLVSQ
ncbi:MAG: GntP family permease [Planctomycetales bacterium]|nr:GntP family permease [Planctomycetales bacterium]